MSSSEIEIKFIKSRGPGGQNVNKVCSGVWIKHFNSNISVRYDTERTQKRNKECALKLLEYKLNILKKEEEQARNTDLWSYHQKIERGNEMKTFLGEKFKLSN